MHLDIYFGYCLSSEIGETVATRFIVPLRLEKVGRHVEDNRQLTDSLRKWYGVDKMYLKGYSWGLYLGIKTVEKYPELYHAYIGIGQVCNLLESLIEDNL